MEDFKIRFGAATVRVGRNAQRASLKIHGFAQKEILNAVNAVARRHAGRFIANGKYWEFRRNLGVETIFRQLCAEVEIECLERLYGSVPPPAPTTPTVPNLSDPIQPAPLPVYFSDPALQEYFDERAGIREFDAGTDRELSEQLAQSDVATAFGLGGIQVQGERAPVTSLVELATEIEERLCQQ